MIPSKDGKITFSMEEVIVTRFALNIFLQTDFSGLTTKKEEMKAKEIAETIIDKLSRGINEFKHNELCVMAGAIDNLNELMKAGEDLNISDAQAKNCKFFLPSAKQKLIELIS